MQVIYKTDDRHHKMTFSYVIERLYRKLIKFLYSLVTLKMFLRIHRENIEIFKIYKKSKVISRDQARLKFWIYTLASFSIVFVLSLIMKYFGFDLAHYSMYLFSLAIIGPCFDMIFVWLRTCEDFRNDEEVYWDEKMKARRNE